jgi:hypothetical protein
VKANFDLLPKTRLQVYGELENGEEFPFYQWKTGATLSYRAKRIFKPHRADIDDENEYIVNLGVGYEYIHTIQSDKTKSENRIYIQATPRYLPGKGFLVQDRNRVEFRWINGEYSVRYRNKLTVQHNLKVKKVLFTPYASGELFYSGQFNSWNENRYSFGVQVPYKRSLMVDFYYLRQNCTTCSQNPVNVWGLTLNLYLRRAK